MDRHCSSTSTCRLIAVHPRSFPTLRRNCLIRDPTYTGSAASCPRTWSTTRSKPALPARIAVADGATEGYESRRWVIQLLEAFLTGKDEDTPRWINRDSLGGWLARMQDLWSLNIPEAADYIDQVKISQGAFATFVGCQL